MLIVVNPHGDVPVYKQVAATLRTRIINNVLVPGERLSSEKDLATEFNVGRDAVREALAMLRGEGLIETRRGHRSQVRERFDRERLPLRSGQSVIARMPNPEERTELRLPEGVPVLVVGEQIYAADRIELYVEDDQSAP